MSGRSTPSRRQFLVLAGGAAGSAVAGAGLWTALGRGQVHEEIARLPAAETPAPSTVLVVVQLGGGNDGLNTLVPADGRYRDARPTIAVPEADLAALDVGGHALHPALAPLVGRWRAGQVAAVQGVGFAGQSRSHFTAMDAWWSGTGGAASTTGWLGRWLDATEGPTANPLRAIALGAGAPALTGRVVLPTVVLSPAQFALRPPRGVDPAAIADALLATSAPTDGGPWLVAARAAIPGALEAIRLFERVRTRAGDVPGETELGGASAPSAGATPAQAPADSVTGLLQVAAGIIELDIGTRVVHVGTSGFDTHAGQAAAHAALLSDLGTGITAFFDRLEKAGAADRVLLMTTSEFGRRVAENGSAGTDHGGAGVQFLAAPAIRGGRVIGAAGLDRLVDGDLPIEIDARSLYAVGLDWLGGPTDELLGGRFDRYGLL
jgi:uncharacterized protein (DUF1501 family)